MEQDSSLSKALNSCFKGEKLAVEIDIILDHLPAQILAMIPYKVLKPKPFMGSRCTGF